MPEGPEVRRHADNLARALVNKPVIEIAARTKQAKAWLEQNQIELIGARLLWVRSRGKNLAGLFENGVYFCSHLMMWGRWHVFEGVSTMERDRRERARIAVDDAIAVLFSAPVFEMGVGDPFVVEEHLAALGPDALPYAGAQAFDKSEFLKRLFSPDNASRAIGAALLDQRIVAGLGNYLRAEILFDCRVDPWKISGDLTSNELDCLCDSIPHITRQAYETGGVTVTPEDRERMRQDSSLVYSPSEWGNRHYVFRRTNLPCLRCGDIIRQLRQTTRETEEGEKQRIIYFCPTCQNVSVELKRPKAKRTNHLALDETAA